jgi:hypothetical protein|tara:strand:+ start:61 stop:429 length:369 start_codon:yes stop_codon:yes gene_type:complete
MLITRKSLITGITHTLEVSGLTQDMLDAWESGTIIQDALAGIAPEWREFVMTGITPSEWAAAFPEDVSEEDVEHEKRLQKMEEDGMAGTFAHTAMMMAGPNPSEEEGEFWDNWKEEMKMQDW